MIPSIWARKALEMAKDIPEKKIVKNATPLALLPETRREGSRLTYPFDDFQDHCAKVLVTQTIVKNNMSQIGDPHEKDKADNEYLPRCHVYSSARFSSSVSLWTYRE